MCSSDLYTVTRDPRGHERARRSPEGAVLRKEDGSLVTAPSSVEDDLDLGDLMTRVNRGLATPAPAKGGDR